jgi:hypothetical protein
VQIGGYNKEVDLAKLGPTLVIASSLVLAIRTARWPRHTVNTRASPDDSKNRQQQEEAGPSTALLKGVPGLRDVISLR